MAPGGVPGTTEEDLEKAPLVLARTEVVVLLLRTEGWAGQPE